jgi:hypothetical protein
VFSFLSCARRAVVYALLMYCVSQQIGPIQCEPCTTATLFESPFRSCELQYVARHKEVERCAGVSDSQSQLRIELRVGGTR